MKKIIKLSTVPEINVENYAILKVERGTVLINGNDISGYDFKCGNCNSILATKIFYKQILNLVLFCNSCKQHNVVRRDWKLYVLDYIDEKVNYVAIVIGFFLMLILIKVDISTEAKVFVNIVIFILALNYKSFEQVFREK